MKICKYHWIAALFWLPVSCEWLLDCWLIKWQDLLGFKVIRLRDWKGLRLVLDWILDLDIGFGD